MPTINTNRVLVTGGGTFLGASIAAALVAEGADVTMLLREGNESRLGPLAQRVRWYTVDMWDAASLRGRARGHGTMIHTVGSMVADPQRGLTYHRLNVISTRNAANVCISDGVPHMMLLSTVATPWVSRQYVRAKREAESYIQRVGLQVSVIRAPLVYRRGSRRPLFYRLMTLLGTVPPFAWMRFGRIAPMPLDMLARGIARISLEPQRPPTAIYYASDLRKRSKRSNLDNSNPDLANETPQGDPQAQARAPKPDLTQWPDLDDDVPFGWTPPKDR
jgi:uncharacterized protein YbjT (DUF2867 family)